MQLRPSRFALPFTRLRLLAGDHLENPQYDPRFCIVAITRRKSYKSLPELIRNSSQVMEPPSPQFLQPPPRGFVASPRFCRPRPEVTQTPAAFSMCFDMFRSIRIHYPLDLGSRVVVSG